MHGLSSHLYGRWSLTIEEGWKTERKKKTSIQFNNSNTFFCKGWWKNTLLFQNHMKTPNPKKVPTAKKDSFPQIHFTKDSWKCPIRDSPPKKSLKNGTFDWWFNPETPNWRFHVEQLGQCPTRLPRGRSTNGKAAARRRFFVGPELRSLTSFFRRKRVHWQHSKSTHLQGRFFTVNTLSGPLLFLWRETKKKNILSCIFDFIQSFFLPHLQKILKDSEKKTSHHRKGPKASISHKVSASPLGNTTPTTLPNIVSWQVTMRRAPPGSIRWMWPQRGLFRGSGSKPIRTCFQQWEVVVF